MKRFILSLLTLALVYTAKAQSNQQPIDSNVLVVVNGKIAGTFRELKKDINSLYQPDLIERIDILKGPEASKKYGDKWKAGVIEITLKNATVLSTNPVDSVYTKKLKPVFPVVTLGGAGTLKEV